MEKLEFKKITPYLPYGLNMLYDFEMGDIWILDITNIDAITKHDKPILRPLSDLFNGDLDYLETEHETDYFSECSIDFVVSALEHNTLHCVIEFLPHGLVEWLISKHYDVYNLIGQGNAVNINKL